MHVLHIFLSPIRHETRLFKECSSSRDRWPESHISVAGLWEPELPGSDTVGRGIEISRIRIATRSWPRNMFVQLIKYLEWTLRIFSKYRREDFDIIQAHSLAALGPAVLLKWATKAALVYDAHELEARKSSRRGVRQWFAARTEHMLIRFADSVIVVGDRIADWYSENYDIPRPVVVRNIPDLPQQDYDVPQPGPIREKLSIDNDDLVFLYQGMLSVKRAIPRFLDVFSKAHSDRHVVFMGYGPIVDEIREHAERFANIHYLPAVPSEEVLRYTVGADVGICGMGTGSLSYKLSLPNKFFEYLFAGLPVLVGDRPEQERFLEQFDCGWKVEEDDSEFVALLNRIDRNEVHRKRQGATRAREELSWDREADKLLAVYDKAMS